MSNLVTPILMINVGCEAMYIVQQRLSAQDISRGRTSQILNECVGYLLDTNRLRGWFAPQAGPTLLGLRQEIERLVNASIMKISGPSMDKLFDLGIMMFKYQIIASVRVEQLIDITRLHLSTVADIITKTSNPWVSNKIVAAQQLVEDNYASIGKGALHLMRQCMLQLLQEQRIKVSILLDESIQTGDGPFLLPSPIGVGVGACSLYDENGRCLRAESIKVFGETAYEGTYYEHTTPLGSDLFSKTFTPRLVLPPADGSPHVDTHFGAPVTPARIDAMHGAHTH